MDIKFNFINKTRNTNSLRFVLFQKNISSGFDESAIAWTVIENLAPGDNHPFIYPDAMEIGAGDSYGNYMPKLDAEYGQLFHVLNDGAGDVLKTDGSASSVKQVQLRNDLNEGAISGGIYKDEKLLLTKDGIAPDQIAVFEIEPRLWIGVFSEVEEGDVISSEALAGVDAVIDLRNLISADIVATGGGTGEGATKIRFSLENAKYH